MPFKFKSVPKKNPRNPAAPAKYYASPSYSGEVTIRQLAAQIADISTVSSVDVLAVLEAFLQQIPKELIQGRIVRLRDFGTFRITLNSEGAETESGLSGTHIKKLKLNFRPSKEFSDITGTVKFEKA
jgi:predicted histone-like DNA-binding protein